LNDVVYQIRNGTGIGVGARNMIGAAPFLPGLTDGSDAITASPRRSGRLVGKGPAVSNSPVSLSVVSLFLHADVVVKGVLLLLLAGSVWSWAVIIDKLWRLAAAARSASAHEGRLAAAKSAAELVAPSGRSDGSDPAQAILAAGWSESAETPEPLPETPGERRQRIERAMRLALGAELRRLEARLPFLATLGSAAPFIGLFGTVWGIMRSFTGIAAANNTSLAVVAPGIAEALFATAMGLFAAIPAVVAYNKITVDLGRFSGRMNALIARASNILARPLSEG
jgi:biopolymer transport protein TolQ